MRTIYKYPVPLGYFQHQLPWGSKVVAVATQNGNAQMWVEQDTAEDKTTREFVAIGTGHEIPGGYVHRATWQDPPFVWHLYERACIPGATWKCDGV